VLLTRGRDGTIIFVPPNLADGQQTKIVSILKDAGARELKHPSMRASKRRRVEP